MADWLLLVQLRLAGAVGAAVVGWLVMLKQLCLVGDVGAAIYDWLIVANGAAVVSCLVLLV